MNSGAWGPAGPQQNQKRGGFDDWFSLGKSLALLSWLRTGQKCILQHLDPCEGVWLFIAWSPQGTRGGYRAVIFPVFPPLVSRSSGCLWLGVAAGRAEHSDCGGWASGGPEGRGEVSSGLHGLCWLVGCSQVSLVDWCSVLLGKYSCITLGLLFLPFMSFFITTV